MNILEGDYKDEQNKLAAPGAWIWLLEITTTGYSAPLRFTNNNSSLTWPTGSESVYTAIPLTMEDIEANLEGKFPECRLQIGELVLNSTLRTRVRATNGLIGSIIRMLVVHSSHLALTEAAIDESAEVLSCEVSTDVVTFVLGIPSLLNRRFPRDKYVPGFCRHKFTGALCQYVAAIYTDCDHTLADCKLRNNTRNYGGSPGIVGGMYG
ncbi:MAG: hypothetical protein NWE89_11535 [Candidatus Bathyarchaeota archaeon]|nr:hypothetical protein [Candidatus Bathyarchaeota archaeon]